MSGEYSMMTLGSFTFGLSTAAYQEFKRSTEFYWPSQARFGSAPAVQGIGLGDDTIQLAGVILPEWNGGLGQVDRMREIAGQMEPLTMIDGLGNIMGKWVIERVEETGTIFAQAGVARKQEFSLGLKKFDDQDAQGVLSSISSGVAAAAAGGLPSGLAAASKTVSGIATVKDLVASVTATANAALSTAGTIAGKIGFAANNVNRIASALGVHAPIISKSLTRSLDVMNGIRTSASGGLEMVRKVQTVASATSSVQGVFNDVSTFVQPAANASASIKASLAALTASGATQEAISVTTDALVAANNATHTAYALQDVTNKTIQQRIAVFGPL